MRGSTEFRLPNGFRKLLFLAASLALFCLLPVIAQEAQGNDASAPALDLPLAQVGVALVSSKEAHRVFILDILGTIHDVDRLRCWSVSLAS